MENLNIENLFTYDNGIKPFSGGNLDINTLFRQNNINPKNYKFDTKVLVDSVKRKKEKIHETYMKLYKSCCDTIINANKFGQTDIVFEIPEQMTECVDYNPIDCITLIKQKLEIDGIRCYQLSSIRLFVTWKMLEIEIELDIDKEIKESIGKESERSQRF